MSTRARSGSVMISQQTFKRERRRLAIALGRSYRASLLVPPNPYSNELEGKGLELVARHALAVERLHRVAVEGLEIFEQEGYPDSWHSWENAASESARELRRLELDGEEHEVCTKHGSQLVIYADGSSLCARCYLERSR
jgi:hypothetical protein